MKVQFQLLLDSELKQRLESLKEQTGIPIARFINDIIRENLYDLESKFETINKNSSSNKVGIRRLKKK